MRAAINRHLKDINRDIDIVRDKPFTKANDLLNAKLKFMTKSGMSRPTQHKKIISQNDMMKINSYLSNVNDPQILQYNVWYSLAIHFVSRGLEFHHQLNLNSFVFESDDSGREYVTLSHETCQKNVQGGLGDYEAVADKRMYATGDDHCPVASLRNFLGHCDPTAPALFCRIKQNPLQSLGIWYTCKPLSKRMFSKFMSNICEQAQCSTSYTAHSLRATAIQQLSNAGLETRHIMLMSGHRNEASVRSYSRDCSVEQKRHISDILSMKSLTSESHTSPVLALPVCTSDASDGAHALDVRAPATLADSIRQPLTAPSASQTSVINNNTSMSATRGILGHSSFNNCQFSFVFGKSSQ